MVLPRQEIRRLIEGAPPLIASCFDLEAQLQPNGFDLSVRDVSRFTSAGAMGSGKNRTIAATASVPVDEEGFFTLAMGPYLATFNEVVSLPIDLMAFARTRSSLLRCGVVVPSAVWDAGYSGRSQSLVVVQNPAGFRLQRNARILQLIFCRLGTAADAGYRGIFQKENL